MLWITLRTKDELQYLDAMNFLIQEDGSYNILLRGGLSLKGFVEDIQFIHVEAVIQN